MARKKRISGVCKLCENEAMLCQSHIIPEMCYRPFYDDKSRALLVDPYDIETPGKIQSGLKEYMLCENCEGLLNDRYEKVFRDKWVDPKRFNEVGDRKHAELDGFSHPEFKLFHLSVLLRGHFSTLANFAEVQLPPRHVNRLRSCILSGESIPQDEYPVIAMLIGDNDGVVRDDVVGPAHRIRLDGFWGYQFAFSGGQWLYFVSSHAGNPLAKYSIDERGVMPVAVQPWWVLEKVYRPEFRRRQRGSEG